jgi:hypothetical protein
MSKITELASGQIHRTDSISVILVRPEGMPPSVIIHWPEQPTVSVPLKFAEVASAAVKILARSSTELSRILGKRRRKPQPHRHSPEHHPSPGAVVRGVPRTRPARAWRRENSVGTTVY